MQNIIANEVIYTIFTLYIYNKSANVKAPVKCKIKDITSRTINIKNKILAIPAVAAEIPVNPNNAATNEITKNNIISSNIMT